MEKHNCRELLGNLSEYVDGSLGNEICKEIERHLQECEDCRIVVDSLRKTIYLYHATAENPTVPSNVRKRLFHRLNLDDFVGP